MGKKKVLIFIGVIALILIVGSIVTIIIKEVSREASPAKITSMSVEVSAENFPFDQGQKGRLTIRIFLKDNKGKNVYVGGKIRYKIYEQLPDNSEGNLVWDTNWYAPNWHLSADDLERMAEGRSYLMLFFDDMKPSPYNFGIFDLTFTTNGRTFEAKQVVPIKSI